MSATQPKLSHTENGAAESSGTSKPRFARAVVPAAAGAIPSLTPEDPVGGCSP